MDHTAKGASRRKACDQCKQQKLRCDLSSREDETCARCERLGLTCTVELGFRRERKRKRSRDLEAEVQQLQRQLDETRRASMSVSGPPTHSLISADDDGSTRPSEISPDATEPSRAPGLTTKPGLDEPTEQPHSSSLSLPRPRALGNIALSVEEIEELFAVYTTHYHPFLPIIDTTTTLHEIYPTSDLLFWSIVSVSSRRLPSRPTLLPKLARNVTDLLWRAIRSVPYSIATVQSLALICTWPFPTNSSTADPTFILAGAMLHIAAQMGLHRARHARDFVKVLPAFTDAEYGDRVRTWDACNIVALSVGAGCGLPVFVHAPELSSSVHAAPDASLAYHLRLERFRHRVTSVLSVGSTTSLEGERSVMYRLLDSELINLGSDMPQDASPPLSWYLAMARLHLHSFCLLDSSSLPEYNDRVLKLYQSACNLIELASENPATMNNNLEYHPFFCTQMFISAAFTILRISTNGFFRSLIDTHTASNLTEAAIAALRKASVVNNDLPARLGDVIGFFCALPDTESIGGKGVEDLQLREVRNRLSVSVVYDSLWTWRSHFLPGQRQQDQQDQETQQEVTQQTSYLDDQQGMYGWLSNEEFAMPSGMGGWMDLDLFM